MRRERPRARVVNAGEIGEPDRQIIDEMQANAGSSNGPVETEPSSGVTPGIPLSILDLAPIRRGETASDSFAASVTLAQRAEQLGYRRVWYAEHHNIPRIASSATACSSPTSRPIPGDPPRRRRHHAAEPRPLVIAEQFGTLEALHPGRIDLGLGRAPGTDQITMRALRRNAASADTFPEDVLELQGYLGDETRVPGVEATPGKGTQRPALHPRLVDLRRAARRVARAPLRLRVALRPGRARERGRGLPPRVPALRAARHPYVIAGVNVIAADTAGEAQEQFLAAKRSRVRTLLGRGRASATKRPT